MYGFETADSQCGFSAVSSDMKRKHTKKMVEISADDGENISFNEIELSIEEVEPFARDAAKAVHGFVKAVEHGHAAGIVPLAFALIHGVGLESIIQYQRPLATTWDIPDTLFSVDAQKVSDLHGNKLRKALGLYLTDQSLNGCNSSDFSSQSSIFSVVDSVLFNEYYQRKSTDSGPNQLFNTSTTTISNDLSLGLLFIAALHNDAEAQVALSYR
jgi:TPR repeat protein